MTTSESCYERYTSRHPRRGHSARVYLYSNALGRAPPCSGGLWPCLPSFHTKPSHSLPFLLRWHQLRWPMCSLAVSPPCLSVEHSYETGLLFQARGRECGNCPRCHLQVSEAVPRSESTSSATVTGCACASLCLHVCARTSRCASLRVFLRRCLCLCACAFSQKSQCRSRRCPGPFSTSRRGSLPLLAADLGDPRGLGLLGSSLNVRPKPRVLCACGGLRSPDRTASAEAATCCKQSPFLGSVAVRMTVLVNPFSTDSW